MEKTVLNDVFEFLKEIQAVDNESEFSKDWLGRSECYMRTLRFKQASPSIGTLAICANKLAHYGNRLKEQKKHNRISEQMITLSLACQNQIGFLSETQWMEK